MMNGRLSKDSNIVYSSQYRCQKGTLVLISVSTGSVASQAQTPGTRHTLARRN